MTVRRPLKLVDRNNFSEMSNLESLGSNADMFKIHQRIAYLYAQSPVVTLSFVSSNGNISPVMSDTRYKSGPAVQFTSGNWPQVTQTPTSSDTGPPQIVTTTFDKVSQTVASDPGAPPTYTLKPVRVDGTNAVIEMSETDVVDTFIDPILDKMESETTDLRAGGSYFVSTSSTASNSTALGIIFTDTKTNTSSYTSGNISTSGTFQDHSVTVNNYYLFQNDGANVTCPLPLIVDGTSGLREMTTSEFDTYFLQLIKAHIHSETGNTLRYNFDGSGTTKGTAIQNSVLTSVGSTFVQDLTRANDYRAQEFPTGTNVASTIHRLKLERT
tara:strand:- start:1262 stop:2242 length:981 start_codon:yes stop_codon:yes gene_type:complete